MGPKEFCQAGIRMIGTECESIQPAVLLRKVPVQHSYSPIAGLPIIMQTSEEYTWPVQRRQTGLRV